MTWIKLDDKAPRHPKVASLTDRAFRWWVKGLCYASEFLTNGVLHPIFWKEVPKQSRAELTGLQLWDWDDPNFIIHDYLIHQSSKEDVTQKRADTADRVARYRERRRNAVTGNASNADGNALVTRPENREQRTDTENREQTQSAPAPAKPLISGQANPRDWGKVHSNHVTGFCDWVCLPDFVFTEFVAKSPGESYVREWAAKIRREWEGHTIGDDNLKFWRQRWSESHRTPVAFRRDDAELDAKLAAVERKR